jgi:inosine-uridine nucleoside N-ribohydrolase
VTYYKVCAWCLMGCIAWPMLPFLLQEASAHGYPSVSNYRNYVGNNPGRQVRVIITSDAANEADDQATIAYALLSPKLDVRGIIATHFKPHVGSLAKSESESTEASYREIGLLLRMMKLDRCVPLFYGSRSKFTNADDNLASQGSDFIVHEALSDDQRPLIVVVLGPLTDVALAWRKDQRIADRLTVVWIGGVVQGGPEYNQDSDRIAADVTMRSSIPLWEIPLHVYILPRFSISEANEKISGQGRLGKFLFDRLERFRTAYQPDSEMMLYADLPAIGVLLFPLAWPNFGGAFQSEMREAGSFGIDGSFSFHPKNRKVRVFQSIDHRAILEDFFAKLVMFKKQKSVRGCISLPVSKTKNGASVSSLAR